MFNFQKYNLIKKKFILIKFNSIKKVNKIFIFKIDNFNKKR